MENGLNIAMKSFNKKDEKDTIIEKIYLLEFIDSDEKLLIIGKKENKAKFIVWDIYNTGEPIDLDSNLTIDDPMKKECWNLSGICCNVQIMSGIHHVMAQILDIIKTSCNVRNPPCFGTVSGRF